MYKKILKIKILAFCLIVILSCSKNRPHSNPYDPQNPSNSGSGSNVGYGTITGTVKTTKDVPIRSANIYIDSSTKVSVYTDALGNYTISNLLAGTHLVKVSRTSNANARTNEQTVTVKINETVKCDFIFDYVVLSSPLNGTYSGNDYRLSSSNSPYIVNGDLCLGGFTDNLVIDSGVIIKFSGPYYFFASDSSVIANGTSSAPIQFTSGKPSPSANDYKDIAFGYDQGTPDVNPAVIVLNYVNFEYGSSQSIYGDSNSKITNCTFANNNSDYAVLRLYGEVKNCNFQKNGFSVLIYNSPIISYCNINGYIYANSSAGQYKINYCNLTKGSVYILGNAANYTIDITNNWWGTTNSSTISSYISSTAGSVTYSPYASSSIGGTGPQ